MDLCVNCYKPIATDHHWDSIPEGEGRHLCWQQDYKCLYPSDEAKQLFELRQENEQLKQRIAELEARLV